ncbi:hypothetical protein MNV49_000678 [Pseudohyphozyma bogoriensis]|nr:hypothetical protein MNV49_000678 [Pseudohyphozyma bogoriensis]
MFPNFASSAPPYTPPLPAGYCSICRAPFLPVGSISHLHSVEQRGLSPADVENLTWTYAINANYERPLDKGVLVTDEYGGIRSRLSRRTPVLTSQIVDKGPGGELWAHPACTSLLLAELDLLPYKFDAASGADSQKDRKLYDLDLRVGVDPQGMVLGIVDRRKPLGVAGDPVLCVKMSDAARRDMQRIGWDELQSDKTLFKFTRPDVFTPVPQTVVSSRYNGFAAPSPANGASSPATPDDPIFNLPEKPLKLVLRHLVAPENIARATPASEAKLKDAVKTFLALPFLSRATRHFFLTSTVYQNTCRYLVVAKPKDASGHFAFLDSARFIPGLTRHVDRLSASPAPPTSSKASGDWHYYLINTLTSPTRNDLNRARIYKAIAGATVHTHVSFGPHAWRFAASVTRDEEGWGRMQSAREKLLEREG